ncbi:hypothetical protein A3Q56_03027 [Intoshia linei]|uniref:Guanylate kinase-like domain-containing protein n=1 Tax=Intoshia linei TaxID=1819745 RepID=A0A177B6N3_9BILA|nr:hypothetical protein A3Q56_03027 [Intoshia linei]
MKRFTLSRSKHKQEESFKENIVDVNVIPILSYEFVQQQKCDYPRPVIILGFMKEILCDDLLVRHPDKFLASIPHTSRPIREGEINGRDYHFVSYENMNQDIKDHKFIEAGEYKSNLYATSLQSIKEVMLMEKHCILDVTGKAISRLKSANIHPIVILVKPSSVKIMIDINKNLTNDQALLIFNKIVKIEQDFNQYFDVKVSGENISEVYDKIYATIINHARSIWVKCDVEN